MEYFNAKTSQEALKVLLESNGNAMVIAGGSDVMVDIGSGKIAPQKLVDISSCSDMTGIQIKNNKLVIGGAVTLTEIARSEMVKKYFPSLCKGCGSVGSLQIRNSATLSGNVVTAQPAADGAMALAPLNPLFTIVSENGEREVPITEMYAGFGKSALDCHKEILKEISIPLPEENEKASYIRLELRKSLSLPMLNVAAMAKIDIKEKKFLWARITMGPVGVGPCRATKAEEWIVGKEISKENLEHASTLSLLDAKPRSNPLRGSKEYRESVLPVLVRRALEEIIEQLGLKIE